MTQATEPDAVTGLAAALIPAWTVDCRRCANEGGAYEDDRFKSADILADRGWTWEDGSVYCPQCA